MADAELSLIRFCTMNFFGVLLSSRPMQPISTILLKLVEALISSEPEPDPKHKNRVKWIFENTHEEINCHLSIVELIVFKNLDKGVSFEVTIGDKDFPLSKLYYILDGINAELSMMVIEIAKKYSMDIPLMNFGGSSGIQKINVE